jgi:hypothetical protein
MEEVVMEAVVIMAQRRTNTAPSRRGCVCAAGGSGD